MERGTHSRDMLRTLHSESELSEVARNARTVCWYHTIAIIAAWNKCLGD